MATRKKGRIGAHFEDYLAQEGQLEAATQTAVKRVLAWQIEQAMAEKHLSKSAMAEQMHTTRSQLNRLLDPNNSAITLETLHKAASVVGRELRVELT